MTNANEPPGFNLDAFKLLPAWMKEETAPPSYEGRDSGSYNEPGHRPDRRPPRQGPRSDDRGGSRGPRPGGGRPERDSRGGDRDRRRPAGGQRDDRGPRPSAPVVPAPVRIEFLPNPRALASIAKEVRSTHLAYPLFGLARMFLDRPERHHVKISVESPAPAAGPAPPQSAPPAPATLYQCGEEGPVALQRAALEQIAFDQARSRFYREEVVQKDPPKGNYTNVARERHTGTLLGPTNYHAYQTALRSLYESRFSRRMSFEEYRRDIEIVSDPALVERWKEEVRTVTRFSVVDTPEGQAPLVLNTLAEVREHFRRHYFETFVKSGTSFEIPGPVARNLPEAALTMALRQAHDREFKYPGGMVQPLRAGLQSAGLHIFKHRKRMVYVSAARPVPFQSGGARGGAVSEGIAAILDAIAESPLLTRKQLAERVLSKRFGAAAGALASPAPESPTGPVTDAAKALEAAAPAPAEGEDARDALAKAKAALAADLRYLVQAGHVIELHNGTFDLPLMPRAREAAPSGHSPAEPGEDSPLAESAAEAEPATNESAAKAPENEAPQAPGSESKSAMQSEHEQPSILSAASSLPAESASASEGPKPAHEVAAEAPLAREDAPFEKPQAWSGPVVPRAAESAPGDAASVKSP